MADIQAKYCKSIKFSTKIFVLFVNILVFIGFKIIKPK